MFGVLNRFRRHHKTTFKPVMLVTGCGSGIGLALADLLYLKKEYRVVITARHHSLEFLKQRFVESDRFWALSLDVTDPENRIEVIHEIEARWGSVNVLINNAGVSYRAVMEHMTEADEQRQMATNYLGPVGLIRLVLPKMREVGRGKIINVSSVSGMLAMPTMSSYSASKHALDGASEALWYETKPLGIDVSLIQPGFIRSNSFENVVYTHDAKLAENHGGPYSDYYLNMGPFIRKLMRLSRTSPESVARQILKVIQTENPPLWIPATLDAVLFYYIRRLLPRRLLLPVLLMALPNSKKWGRFYSRSRKRKSEEKS